MKMNREYIDEEGRQIFVKGLLKGKKVTLANMYFPNEGHVIFFGEILGNTV